MVGAIKKRMFVLFAIFLCMVFCFGFLVSKSVTTQTVAPLNIKVVIDAGHGGADGGSVGVSGVTESALNLAYAQKLTEYLESVGIQVENTRLTDSALCADDDPDFKQSDMKKRAEIINSSNAQLLVSIHMNKFTSQESNGAQVFFKQDDTDSQQFATAIKDMLCANFSNARELALKGDYYILNCTNITGVIVECGFLSNPTEEQLLVQQDYRNKMCYSIFCGILNYLGVVRY